MSERAITGGLGPRVARVETELESVAKDIGNLTTDVRTLANSIRQQGENFETHLRQLHVAVTSAAGPRKTDWSAIISAVGVIVAIGTAAMSPLYLRVGDLQNSVATLSTVVREHIALPMHPVGEARIGFVEEGMRLAVKVNEEVILALETRLNQLVDANDKRLAGEFESIRKELHDVKYLGSPITRERLAVLEEQIKRSLKD